MAQARHSMSAGPAVSGYLTAPTLADLLPTGGELRGVALVPQRNTSVDGRLERLAEDHVHRGLDAQVGHLHRRLRHGGDSLTVGDQLCHRRVTVVAEDLERVVLHDVRACDTFGRCVTGR